MARRRIIGNEALFYSAGRLSPGVGAIQLYREQSRLRQVLGWTRWWHWTGLGLAAFLVIDAKF